MQAQEEREAQDGATLILYGGGGGHHLTNGSCRLCSKTPSRCISFINGTIRSHHIIFCYELERTYQVENNLDHFVIILVFLYCLFWKLD